MAKNFLTREGMLSRKRKMEAIELSSGGSVYVSELGARDLRVVRASIGDGEAANVGEGIDATVNVVIAATVDQNGVPFFTDSDFSLVIEQPIADLNLIAQTAFRLSGLNVEEGETEAAPLDPLAG